jgi:protein-disulfide isomerase
MTLSLLLVSCTPNKENMTELLKKNPEILTEAIKANPATFIEALNQAVKDAQGDIAKKREVEEEKKLEEAFDNPLVPTITDDDIIRGTKGAPITLVEYSDFECPFCTRGYQTVISLLEKYKGKIQFVFKHLPLSFHPNAMPAAKYYEALRMQSHDKAIKFHDIIFEEQSKLKLGEKFLKSAAKRVGANMSKLAKDIDSKEVTEAIEADLAEARKYDFQGTPGFLINGIPVKGAYPLEHFVGIIDKLKAKGKVNL